MSGILQELITFRVQIKILRAKAFMFQEQDCGMIVRYIADNMLKRKFIEKLTQLSDRDIDRGSDIIFVHRHRKREYSGIPSHKHLKKRRHLIVLKLKIIQIGPINADLYLSRNIDIFRKGPVPYPFNILDSIICRLPLKSEMTAEFFKIEF